jgi:hypothetical protein
MTIMKLKYILSIVVGIVILASCENFLDLTPHDELSYEQAFSTVSDVQIAARGIYYEMHENTGYFDGQHMILPDIMSDNVILCSEGRLTFDLMHAWDITPGNFYVDRAWSQIYKVVNRCNQVIARSEPVVAEGNDILLKNHSIGEAYAIRGMAYFDLVRYYGKNYADATDSDLGVAYVTDPGPTSPGRNTVKECYNNIVADLKMGEQLMESGSISASEIPIRFNAMAAKAMLARVYLTMEVWDTAISYATEVINAAPMASIANFEDVWRDASDEGVLFKVRMTEADNSSTTSGSTIGVYYNQSSGTDIRSEFVCSYEFFQLLNDPNDVRLGWIFTSEYNGKMFNHILKYKEREGGTVPDLVDAKVLRVAEMYLTRAEASMNLASPDEATALADLNSLRAERYAGFTPGSESGQALRDAIRLERRKELAFEGQRWFDLKRYAEGISRGDFGDEADGGGLSYRTLDLPASSYLWQLPIPTPEMDANDNMIQNDDY